MKTIIRKIFYEKKYKESCASICPKTRKYVSPRKYIVSQNFYIKHGLPDCPHCGFQHTNNAYYHYDIIHGYLLRPNFLGRLFLFDSILLSGIIYK